MAETQACNPLILLTHLPAASGGGVGVGTTNASTKNPYDFNSVLTINDPTDDPDDTYELNDVGVDDQFSLQSEPLPQQDGMQIYVPHKVRKIIRMDGIIKATTLASLEYKAMQMNRYFDPVNAFWDDSSTMAVASNNKGFLAMAFSVPTTDTSHYATGLIPVVAYVRSIQRAVAVATKSHGFSARFNLLLEMVDPRFYHSATQTVSLTNGSGTAHTSATEYPTYPIITFTLTGTPSSGTAINRTSPVDENGDSPTVHLDMTATYLGAAAASGDTVSIDMQNGRVQWTHSGTTIDRPDFLVPGYMGFWPVLPGSNTLGFTGTNMTASMAYERAFA